MKKILSIILFYFFSLASAHAYIHPSFDLVNRIALPKGEIENFSVSFRLVKSSPDSKAVGKVFWSDRINFPFEPSEASEGQKIWPLFSLLLESKPEKLLQKLKNFGVPVKTEEEIAIIISPEDEAEKEPEPIKKDVLTKTSLQMHLDAIQYPFYKSEQNVVLIRHKDQGIAWKIFGPDQKYSLLVQKDSFRPLMLSGPCPGELSSGFFGGGNQRCSIEFNYHQSNRRFRTAKKIIVKKEDKAIFEIRIDRITPNPKKLSKPKSTANAEYEEVGIFYTNFLG